MMQSILSSSCWDLPLDPRMAGSGRKPPSIPSLPAQRYQIYLMMTSTMKFALPCWLAHVASSSLVLLEAIRAVIYPEAVDLSLKV